MAFPRDLCVLRIVRHGAPILHWLSVLPASWTLPPGVASGGRHFHLSSLISHSPSLSGNCGTLSPYSPFRDWKLCHSSVVTSWAPCASRPALRPRPHPAAAFPACLPALCENPADLGSLTKCVRSFLLSLVSLQLSLIFPVRSQIPFWRAPRLRRPRRCRSGWRALVPSHGGSAFTWAVFGLLGVFLQQWGDHLVLWEYFQPPALLTWRTSSVTRMDKILRHVVWT